MSDALTPTQKELYETLVSIPPAPVGRVTATVEKRVREYIMVRDHIKKMDEAHDKAKEEYVKLQNFLTGWLQQFMEQAGADNIKTSEGTCYNSVRYSAGLADPEAFMAFVKSTGSYDLLDRKANVTAVKAYVEEHKVPPPGVNLSALKTVGVRRASGS